PAKSVFSPYRRQRARGSSTAGFSQFVCIAGYRVRFGRRRLRAVGKKLSIGLAATVGYLVYRKRLRDWHLHWGATPEEIEAELPGDELLAEPDVVSTRVVAIDAPRSAVWPWLVQMGPGRGGGYTYDWIENLFGLGMHSAVRIHPEWQHLEVGDTPSLKEGAEAGPSTMR